MENPIEIVLLILAVVGFIVAAVGAWSYSRYGHLTAFGWIGLALLALILVL